MKNTISFPETSSQERRDQLKEHAVEAEIMAAAKLNVFRLDDGAEYWYVAPNEEAALAEHGKFLQDTLGNSPEAAEARELARQTIQQASLASLYRISFHDDEDGTTYPMIVGYLKNPFGCYLLATENW